MAKAWRKSISVASIGMRHGKMFFPIQACRIKTGNENMALQHKAIAWLAKAWTGFCQAAENPAYWRKAGFCKPKAFSHGACQ
jgi:hypothetical protein